MCPSTVLKLLRNIVAAMADEESKGKGKGRMSNVDCDCLCHAIKKLFTLNTSDSEEKGKGKGKGKIIREVTSASGTLISEVTSASSYDEEMKGKAKGKGKETGKSKSPAENPTEIPGEGKSKGQGPTEKKSEEILEEVSWTRARKKPTAVKKSYGKSQGPTEKKSDGSEKKSYGWYRLDVFRPAVRRSEKEEIRRIRRMQHESMSWRMFDALHLEAIKHAMDLQYCSEEVTWTRAHHEIKSKFGGRTCGGHGYFISSK